MDLIRCPCHGVLPKCAGTGSRSFRHAVMRVRYFPASAVVVMALFVLMSGWMANPSAAQDEVVSALPVVTVDQLELKKKGLGRSKKLAGVIEDLAAESVVFRRNSGTPEVIPLKEIAAIRFQKSPEYESGLKHLEAFAWSEAVVQLTLALSTEQRPWVIREIRASIAESCRALGRYEEGIRMMEQILESDPDSRHILMLPLVWDERIPEHQRFAGRVVDLASDSVARQLVAATSLLHLDSHQQQAEAVLRSLKRNGRGSMGAVVEMQLWRLQLLRPGELRILAVEQWQERLKEFRRELRAPGEFLVGRALTELHEYDRAIPAFLWMPLLAPLDPATTAAALGEAAEAAKHAGRNSEANRLQREQQDWLSRTNVVQP